MPERRCMFIDTEENGDNIPAQIENPSWVFVTLHQDMIYANDFEIMDQVVLSIQSHNAVFSHRNQTQEGNRIVSIPFTPSETAYDLWHEAEMAANLYQFQVFQGKLALDRGVLFGIYDAPSED